MKARYWLLAGLAAAILSFAAIDSADAGKRGGGFRSGGGGMKFRGGGFRSFKPRSFRSFSRGHSFRKFGGRSFGHRSFHRGRSYGRSWAGKSRGKYGHHKPYRYSGKHGKKYGHGHSWKKDSGKYHKARHYGRKDGHGWKGRDHAWKGHGRKKYFLDRGGRSSSNVNVYASSGSSSGIDISSIVYAIAAFAADNPGVDDYAEYPDTKTGVVVRYDSKECGCGTDLDKIYEYVKERARKEQMKEHEPLK